MAKGNWDKPMPVDERDDHVVSILDFLDDGEFGPIQHVTGLVWLHDENCPRLRNQVGCRCRPQVRTATGAVLEIPAEVFGRGE